MNETQLDGLLSKMRDAVKPHAEAKANRIYLTEFRKSKLAMLFSHAPEGTVQSKDSWARSQPEYLEILKGIQEAVEIEENLRYRLKIAEMEIDAWRTTQANNRSIDRSHQ